MLGTLIVRGGDRALAGANQRLRRLGMRPYMANACELIAAGAAAALFAWGLPDAGLAAIVVHGWFDYLDGALSRAGAAGGSMRRHACVDKACEALIFTGAAAGGLMSGWLVLAVVAASILGTWLGLRATARHGPARQGALFDRSDRIIVLVMVGAVLNVNLAAWAVLTMSLLVCGQRWSRQRMGRGRPCSPSPNILGRIPKHALQDGIHGIADARAGGVGVPPAAQLLGQG